MTARKTCPCRVGDAYCRCPSGAAWFDILFREIVPERHAKYVYAVAGAIVGATAFVLSQSWGWAVFYDICWGLFTALDNPSRR